MTVKRYQKSEPNACYKHELKNKLIIKVNENGKRQVSWEIRGPKRVVTKWFPCINFKGSFETPHFGASPKCSIIRLEKIAGQSVLKST